MEVVWNGRDALTDSLERDYADMKGDGWDLIWTPPSPLTTPWDALIASHARGIDPDTHVPVVIAKPKNGARLRAEAHALRNEIAIRDRAAIKELAIVSRRGPARKATRVLSDWLPEGERHGGKLTSGGHWRVSHRAMRARKK